MAQVSSIESSTASSSLRMCVTYSPPNSPTGRHTSMISSVGADAAGGYAVPVDTPIAPEAIDSRAISRILAISPGVAARSSLSITAMRNVVWPTRHAAFSAAGLAANSSR